MQSRLRTRAAARVLLIGACCLAASQAQAASPPLYTITDLGTLGGNFSAPAVGGINASGQVVGSSTGVDGNSRAFIWTPGIGMQELPSLGGTQSFGNGINDAGDAVGRGAYSGDSSPRAVQWPSSGGVIDLGTLGAFPSNPLGSSTATDINNAGQIVGNSVNSQGQTRVFLKNPAQAMFALPTLGGALAGALAINEAGLVAGSSFTTGDTDVHAFGYTGSGGIFDLGTPDGFTSNAYGVNDAGVIVGDFGATGTNLYSAMIYTAGNGLSLLGGAGGIPHTHALGINNNDIVVGYQTTAGLDPEFGFVFSDAFGYRDLNTLISPLDPLFGQLVIRFAFGINDAGWIAVDGEDVQTGTRQAYLLTPIAQPVSEPDHLVPLFATFLAFGVARAWAASNVHRRRPRRQA